MYRLLKVDLWFSPLLNPPFLNLSEDPMLGPTLATTFPLESPLQRDLMRAIAPGDEEGDEEGFVKTHLSLEETLQRLEALGLERLSFRYYDDTVATSIEVLKAVAPRNKRRGVRQAAEAILLEHFGLPSSPILPPWLSLLGLSIPEGHFYPPGGKVNFLVDFQGGTLAVEVVQYCDEDYIEEDGEERFALIPCEDSERLVFPLREAIEADRFSRVS